jgi:hypothetical protein
MGFDDQFAMTARTLADTLMRWARDRHDDDKKGVAQLQRELCRLRRAELSDLADADPDASNLTL